MTEAMSIVKNRRHGVILETKTRLKATSKDLVHDRGTGDGGPAIYHCLRRLHAREPHACRECIDAPLESPDQMQQLTGWPFGLHSSYVQGAAET